MKKAALFTLSFVGIIGVYAAMDFETEESVVRAPASVPADYDQLEACKKQQILFSKASESIYKDKELPGYKKMGIPQLFAMSRQEISLKNTRYSDFAPEGWVKYLHRRGSLATVKIVPVSDKYSGVFQGADCGLLRLSLTYKVSAGKPVAPGLALKILRDRAPSANISALVSLNGQEKDFNFFKNPMSNIVPEGSGIGQKLVHRLFRKVTSYPEELLLDDMASLNAQGAKEKEVVSPRQIFFVPAEGLKSDSSPHDVRDDFASIAPETKVYEIRALPEKYRSLDYGTYTHEMAEEFVKESEHIADIVTTSRFISSSFGDDGIFFRHQLRQ
ncbi:MAG: hypothetical protein V4598_04970 [Bdellovibrionota bacterium]